MAVKVSADAAVIAMSNLIGPLTEDDLKGSTSIKRKVRAGILAFHEICNKVELEHIKEDQPNV